jgi:polysaccharide export outer membrane protein
MTMKLLKILLIFLVSLLLVEGCSILQPNKMFETGKGFQFDDFEPVDQKEYRIQPYDIISLSVSTNDGYKLINTGDGQSSNRGNSRMEIEYLVEYDGFVKVPTLGRISLSGQTIREAEAQLETEYSKFYKKPFVLLRVNNRKVYIFKSGGQSGSVLNIPEDRLTLIEALAMSGGIPDGDKAYSIKLIRGDVSGNPKVFKYNVSSFDDIKGSNLLLQANDIIYIDSRPRYVRRVLTELTPYLSLLSTILLIQNLF